MSASFPTGAYTFSHGLESAIADGTVRDPDSVRGWLLAVLERGSGRNDAIVAAASHAAVTDDRAETLTEINARALALSAGAERYRESVTLGASFRRAAAPWLGGVDPLLPLRDRCALPVAVGALSALAGLPRLPLLAASLQSSVANLAWIAARLVPLGQSDTLAILASLELATERVAVEANAAKLDELGGCALLEDIDSLRHERLSSRVCRT